MRPLTASRLEEKRDLIEADPSQKQTRRPSFAVNVKQLSSPYWSIFSNLNRDTVTELD